MNEFEDDEVFAKFLNYMKKSLYYKRIRYIRKINDIRDKEVSIDLNDSIIEPENIMIDNYSYFEGLNKMEQEILKLHYEHGLKYEDIAKIKKSNKNTIKQIRNRAIIKIKKKLEEMYEKKNEIC